MRRVRNGSQLGGFRLALVWGLVFVGVLCATPLTVLAAGRWVTLAPAEHHFSVAFPREPRFRRTATTDTHGTWINFSWVAVRGGEVFHVAVKDYSTYDIAGLPTGRLMDITCQMLDANAVITPVEGRVPGRRCVLNYGNERSEALVYWSAPRLYLAQSACGPGRCSAEDRQRFLTSFRLN